MHARFKRFSTEHPLREKVVGTAGRPRRGAYGMNAGWGREGGAPAEPHARRRLGGSLALPGTPLTALVPCAGGAAPGGNSTKLLLIDRHARDGLLELLDGFGGDLRADEVDGLQVLELLQRFESGVGHLGLAERENLEVR